MKSPRAHRFLTAALIVTAALLAAPQTRAQAELATARALVAARAKATDDPDARARGLVQAALAAGASPTAALLLEDAMALRDEVARPRELLDLLMARREPLAHGLAEQNRRELRHLLSLACGSAQGRPGAPPLIDPFADRASDFLVIGPFGDSGDHHLGVEFPPEVRFPDHGAELAGRFGTVRPRVVGREPFAPRTPLIDPVQRREGCYYALHRVASDAPRDCFVELECAGAFEVFVNGRPTARHDRALAPGFPVHWLPVRLVAGDNYVVIKTCTNDRADIALRYVGPDAHALADLRKVPATRPVTAPPTALDPGDLPAPVAPWQAWHRRAAAAGSAEDAALLRVAAALAADRHGESDALLGLLAELAAAPAADPALLLAQALALRSARDLPSEVRSAGARDLEEKAIALLPEDHHGARQAKVRHLEEGDRREEALTILRRAIDAGRAGPDTFATAHRIVRRLRFEAEERRLLQQWAAACPGDARPLVSLAEAAARDGSQLDALGLYQSALARRPDDRSAAGRALVVALEAGQTDAAVSLLDHAMPRAMEPDSVSLLRRQWEAYLAGGGDDRPAALAAIGRVAAHANAQADTLRQAGDMLLQRGDRAGAASAFHRSLALEPDQHVLREVVARLEDDPEPHADLEQFRRDGDAAIAAFAVTERDAGASSTLLIDQMIVEVLPDGSQLEEVHQLRRINDHQGVEAFRTAHQPASAGELLLLRTVGTDGRSYVPVRVDRTFSMPKLEPGAFVEWRYRNHSRGPGPAPWRSPRFSFQSADEPYLLSELVLVLPTGARGELRTRAFTGAAERIELALGRTATVLRMADVERLPEERNAPPETELVAIAGHGEDATFAPLLRQTRHALLARSRPEPAVGEQARALALDALSDTERIARCHAFCHGSIDDGPADGPTATLLRSKGDRFLLLFALCRAADVPFEIGLCVQARDALLPDGDPLFTDWDRFGVASLRLLPRDGAPLWLFPDAPRHWPLGRVPGGRVGAAAMLATAGGTALVRVPGPADAVDQVFQVTGTAALGEDGEMRLQATVEIGDVVGFSLAERIRQLNAEVRDRAAQQIAQRLFAGFRLRTARAVVEPLGAPLRLEVELSRRMLQGGADGRFLLPLPLPPGQFVAAFGDRAERKLPMHLDAEMRTEWALTVDLGPFRATALPPAAVVQHALLDYALSCTRSGDGLRIRRQATVRAGRIAAEAFDDWMRALQRADQAEEQTVELVR